MKNFMETEMKKALIFLLFGLASCASHRELKTVKSVDYFCGTQSVTLHLAEREEALLQLDGHEFFLKQTISASGVRYADKSEDVVFWGKGNEASLEIDKTIYPKCLEKEIN
ncbi:MAG: MliC family protein [Alphaproteobacteria bacterium]|nr:MliC family protein [Alphaproteobacteria bacterium]